MNNAITRLFSMIASTANSKIPFAKENVGKTAVFPTLNSVAEVEQAMELAFVNKVAEHSYNNALSEVNGVLSWVFEQWDNRSLLTSIHPSKKTEQSSALNETKKAFVDSLYACEQGLQARLVCTYKREQTFIVLLGVVKDERFVHLAIIAERSKKMMLQLNHTLLNVDACELIGCEPNGYCDNYTTDNLRICKTTGFAYNRNHEFNADKHCEVLMKQQAMAGNDEKQAIQLAQLREEMVEVNKASPAKLVQFLMMLKPENYWGNKKLYSFSNGTVNNIINKHKAVGNMIDDLLNTGVFYLSKNSITIGKIDNNEFQVKCKVNIDDVKLLALFDVKKEQGQTQSFNLTFTFCGKSAKWFVKGKRHFSGALESLWNNTIDYVCYILNHVSPRVSNHFYDVVLNKSLSDSVLELTASNTELQLKTVLNNANNLFNQMRENKEIQRIETVALSTWYSGDWLIKMDNDDMKLAGHKVFDYGIIIADKTAKWVVGKDVRVAVENNQLVLTVLPENPTYEEIKNKFQVENLLKSKRKAK